MKAKKYFTATILMLIFSSPSARSELSAGEVIRFTATIRASCTIEVPSLVTLQDLPYSIIAGKTPGEMLTGYETTFDLKSECAGTRSYTLTFKPKVNSGVNLECLGSENGLLRFCLTEGDNKISFAQGPTSITGVTENNTGTKVTTITVTPQVGVKQSPGVAIASMTVSIEPL